MKYNWQQRDWPKFRYELSGVQDVLYALAEKIGRVSGMLQGLPEEIQTETIVGWLVSEAIKTSEIEGEYVSREDVLSSIRSRLGLVEVQEDVKDGRARGVADLVWDVRQTFADPLTEEMLFRWHRTLLSVQAVSKGIQIGCWRIHPEPMQVISGRADRPRIHFEAPPSQDVPGEMGRFIDWFNVAATENDREIKPAAVRAAMVHLYFISVHPFEDGNGRIARALSDKALAQGLGRPLLMSVSTTIEAHKRGYYRALEKAQRSNEITGWVSYFVETLLSAQQEAEDQVAFVLAKAKFFDRFEERLNERHLLVINRILKEGPKGFVGGMSAKKYMSITGASKATATRDLQHLSGMGALTKAGRGRSTRYQLNLPHLQNP